MSFSSMNTGFEHIILLSAKIRNFKTSYPTPNQLLGYEIITQFEYYLRVPRTTQSADQSVRVGPSFGLLKSLNVSLFRPGPVKLADFGPWHSSIAFVKHFKFNLRINFAWV